MLLFCGEPLGSRSDIYVLSIEDGTSKVAIGGEGQQRFPTFSPDGRWIAYTSDHTGRLGVYVQPYPELNRPIPISTDGGFEPHWSPASGELFYRSGNRMIAVEVRTEPTLTPGRETVLFTGDFAIDPSGDQSYDVFPDGQSFAMIQTHAVPAPQLRVVTGLGEELREEVPAQE